MQVFTLSEPIPNQKIYCEVLGKELTLLQCIELRNFLTAIIDEHGKAFYESNKHNYENALK